MSRKLIGVVVPVLSNFRGFTEAIASFETEHTWQPWVGKQWERNRAISSVWNEGIDFFVQRDFDYVLVINDDILLTTFTVDNMVEYFENADDDILMVSACNDRGNIDTNYGGPKGVKKIPKLSLDQGNVADHPDFSCFMVNKRLVEEVGQFDENFIPAYFEDNDMHLRIYLAGFRAVCHSACPYYHYASQSEKDEHFHKCFESNRSYFSRKWNSLPMQPGEYPDTAFKIPFNNSNMTIKDW